MKVFILVSILSLLTGCPTKYVNVPVWVCPETTIPTKATLKTKTITEEGSTDEILRAMASDIIYLEGYSLQLNKLLEGYNSKASEIKNLPNPKER